MLQNTFSESNPKPRVAYKFFLSICEYPKMHWAVNLNKVGYRQRRGGTNVA